MQICPNIEVGQQLQLYICHCLHISIFSRWSRCDKKINTEQKSITHLNFNCHTLCTPVSAAEVPGHQKEIHESLLPPSTPASNGSRNIFRIQFNWRENEKTTQRLAIAGKPNRPPKCLYTLTSHTAAICLGLTFHSRIAKLPSHNIKNLNFHGHILLTLIRPAELPGQQKGGSGFSAFSCGTCRQQRQI